MLHRPERVQIAGPQQLMTLAEELRAFNEKRKADFGRAPTSEERLPIPRTMVGADIPDQAE